MSLTQHAIDGYGALAGAKCPHLWSSSAAMAWHVGRWLRSHNLGRPLDVTMSRGYTLNVTWAGAIQPEVKARVRWHDDDTITMIDGRTPVLTIVPTTQAAE